MDVNAELLISADSHVMESPTLWQERLPVSMRDLAPTYRADNPLAHHPGGSDPIARISAMATDGVSAEILYPSLAMDQFGMEDSALQEACFRVYNDWLIEYCTAAPDRLFGVGVISTFDIGNAIVEMERVRRAGLRGVMIWQVPPPELAFSTSHYERFWAAAQGMNMPVSFHIVTGAPYRHGVAATLGTSKSLRELMHFSVNTRLQHVVDPLTDIIGSGVLDRYEQLKIVLVESEISWMPFIINQWDKYFKRLKGNCEVKLLPSEYFGRQIYPTFFNDPPARWILDNWGTTNCMWSNDFPHVNSTWPKSREVIARDLGNLSDATRARLLHGNVSHVYGLADIAALPRDRMQG